jgi:excisionase family DNA binding protein
MTDKLTASAAAGRLGVSVRTLSRYVAEGLLSPSRTAGGHRRFDPGTVDRLKAILDAAEPQRPPPQPTELPPA